MKARRFGLAARLTLLTAAVVIAGQLVNAAILAKVQADLRMERARAVVAERASQATRFADLTDDRGRRFSRRARAVIRPGPPPEGTADPEAEALLLAALEDLGITGRAVTVRLTCFRGREALVAGVELGPGEWLTLARPLPPDDGIPWRAIAIQTLVLTVILLIPVVYIGRRVALPLRQLTAAADGMLTGEPALELPRGGPPDIRALRDAFAAMEGRVLGALEERSVMLGALGHDLRTPLASLRIRVEEVGDETLRSQMIESIDRLGATLEDILAFSKAAATTAREEVRSDALARALAAEYGEERLALGELAAVSLAASPDALMRALRNLVDNAVRYAGRAVLEVRAEEGRVRFAVLDRGPGLPPEAIEEVQRPFARLEGSRSRRSGGAGLGLAIARAVAEADGGSLHLANREGGGMEAAIILPAAPRV